MKIIGLALAGMVMATAAQAEVIAVKDNGFEVRQTAEVKASAIKVYEALIKVGAWWDSGHSWSGDAANIRIDPKVGGCWCETLPNGGGVKHMEVTGLAPGKSLHFTGGLGPLRFTGASGHMNWTLAEKDGVTTVTWTYAVGGFAKDGFATWAPAVDGVLGAALKRFKTYAETGRPT